MTCVLWVPIAKRVVSIWKIGNSATTQIHDTEHDPYVSLQQN